MLLQTGVSCKTQAHSCHPLGPTNTWYTPVNMWPRPSLGAVDVPVPRGAARRYQGNCPHACPSGTFSLPLFLPSLSTEWQLKGSCSGRKKWLHQLVPTSLQSSQPGGEEGVSCLPGPAPGLYATRYLGMHQSATHCFHRTFFFFLMSKYEAILRSIPLKLGGKGK